jgi:hypothetical protein
VGKQTLLLWQGKSYTLLCFPERKSPHGHAQVCITHCLARCHEVTQKFM